MAAAAAVLPFIVHAQTPAPSCSIDSAGTARLPVTGGALAGTLMHPDGRAPWPLVLIIAGSGPTDRDGNSPLLPGKNNSLRLIADTLRARGVASLRYDKRGAGEGAGLVRDETAVRFPQFVDDAVAWVQCVGADRRFSSVSLLGHSEGALVATLAAERVAVRSLVLVSGAGRSVGTILREQLKNAGGDPARLAAANRVIDSLEAGRTVDSVPTPLWMLFRPSVQPYLISWLPLDPAAELARVKVPVLVLQGTHDLQISEADAGRLAAGHANVRKVVVSGMNHVLKAAPADRAANIATYSNPALPLAPGFAGPLIDFLLQVTATSRR